MPTEREKFDIAQKKIQIYNLRGGTCEVCGKVIPYAEAQIAHRICKSKANLKKYGKEIIHHNLNLALTCSLKCNSGVNISNKSGEIRNLVQEMVDCLQK